MRVKQLKNILLIMGVCLTLVCAIKPTAANPVPGSACPSAAAGSGPSTCASDSTAIADTNFFTYYTSAVWCVASITYPLVASKSVISGDTMYFIPLTNNSTQTTNPPPAVLCPGKYYIHLHFNLSQTICGGNWCGVQFLGLYDGKGNTLISGNDISDHPSYYNPKIEDFYSSTANYNPANGFGSIAVYTDSSNTIYCYQGLGCQTGGSGTANYVALCTSYGAC